MLAFPNPNCTLISKPHSFPCSPSWNQSSIRTPICEVLSSNCSNSWKPLKPPNSSLQNPNFSQSARAVANFDQSQQVVRIRWGEINPNEMDDSQRNYISQLPKKMPNRCRALMKQLIWFSAEKFSLRMLLGAWVKSMKPDRADWLVVLKELENLNHPLYLEVADLALLEESFEPNIRDYTKLIHAYAKQTRLQDAENTFQAMKTRGFECDQVTLTALVHMYSKSGNLELAKTTFDEMKLLGHPLDNRSYGSMVMAYIRAGKLTQAEALLREMESQQLYAKREVYKAMLRAYSMKGDSVGAQRTFDAIQVAGIVPDDKICALLVNAYVGAGQNREACVAFENMMRGGVRPNDKCVALVLGVYEKENRVREGFEFLMGLEREGIVIGREVSERLARWLRDLGVIEEVELLLRDFEMNTLTRQIRNLSRESKHSCV